MKLNQSQQEYISNHRADSPKALAKASGLSVKTVNAFIKTLPPIPEPTAVEPVKELSEADGRVKIAKFDVNEGSVIMTAAQSSDDDLQRADYEPTSEAYNKAHEKDIFKFTLKAKKIVPK